MQLLGLFSFCFASLLEIPIGNTSSAVGLKIWAIAAGIKKYKAIIKKKKKNHGTITLLAKTKLSSVEILISKALIDLNISHDEFVLTNNVLKKFDDKKDKIKTSNK